MIKHYKLEDFTQDSFLHGTIEKISYDAQNKYFQVVFSYLNFTSGGCLYDCTITITDWWSITTSFTRGDEALDINGLTDLISKNPIDCAIYENIIDNNDVTLNGHVGDCLFSFKFTKPKIQITGEYDPD